MRLETGNGKRADTSVRAEAMPIATPRCLGGGVRRPCRTRSTQPPGTAAATFCAVFFLAAATLLAESVSNPYEYDVSAFEKVASNLVRFAEQAPIAPAVKSPHALAVDGAGRLLVAGDGEAVLLDRDGKKLGGFAIPGTAGCAAFLPGGDILIGLHDHVERFDRDGKPLATWTAMGENAVLTSLSAISNLVFLADAGNRVVWRFDADGRLLGQIGSESEDGQHHFVVPSPYFDAVAAADRVWVTNPGRQRVEAYTAAGTFVSQWGKAGMQIDRFCGCCNPVHLALMPGGAFVTAEKGMPRVKVHAASGALECVVAGPAQFALPAGMSCQTPACIGDLAVDDRGRVLVLDATKGVVRVFARKP